MKNQPDLPCLCMTCGVRDDHTQPSAFCQNDHDNWLEYEDVIYRNQFFIQAVNNSGLSEEEFTELFMDKDNKFIKQAP